MRESARLVQRSSPQAAQSIHARLDAGGVRPRLPSLSALPSDARAEATFGTRTALFCLSDRSRLHGDRGIGQMGHTPDGKLASWAEVAEEEAWRNLLVGNGLSSHVWPPFRYGSLYAQACGAGLLKPTDRELFTANATENFESVLTALATTIKTLETLSQPREVKRLRARYLRIQRALGAAVREVHIDLVDLPDDTRESIRDTLRDYRWVFTTSYDLILYWSAGYEERFDGFLDYFYCNGRLEFDPMRTAIGSSDDTRIVYLHGALHLVVNEAGVTRKQKRTRATLLEQFGAPDPNDPLARPLLIAEGSATEKAGIILANDYLSFGLNRLRRSKQPLVIFGLSLRDEDAHLVDALNFRSKRPIAIGMRPRSPRENRKRQAKIRELLETDDLYFYNATTHPLGDPDLAG
jgi:hypothetical protein